ncbi:hypothetical protein CRV24_007411 [Beauveria bassiana]|nr:hypothetical protein CRV24_007411 [Beauveria bassiana]
MVRLPVAAVLTFALSVYAVGDPAGAADVGNGQGKQFITGGCLSDADCRSGCCAGLKDGAQHTECLHPSWSAAKSME